MGLRAMLPNHIPACSISKNVNNLSLFFAFKMKLAEVELLELELD